MEELVSVMEDIKFLLYEMNEKLNQIIDFGTQENNDSIGMMLDICEIKNSINLTSDAVLSISDDTSVIRNMVGKIQSDVSYLG